MSGLAAIEGHYPTEHADETLYRSAFVPVLALVLAGPQLGMGRKALELVTKKAAGKAIAYTFFTAQADSTAFQLQLAEAALMIDTAHLHAYRSADDIDRAAAAGVYPDTLLRARVRADTGWALRARHQGDRHPAVRARGRKLRPGQSAAADLARLGRGGQARGHPARRQLRGLRQGPARPHGPDHPAHLSRGRTATRDVS